MAKVKIWVISAICETHIELLNSLNWFYKPLLQNTLSSFNQSFGGKKAQKIAFAQFVDNEQVTKPPIAQLQVKAHLSESKGYFEDK